MLLSKFNEVKLSSMNSGHVNDLFKVFNFKSILKRSKICKEKGYTIISQLFIMLLIFLKDNNSIYHGLRTLMVKKMKTPINDMLNNPKYNWRDLLYRIAKRFCKLISVNDKGYIIIDDTSKKKSGRKCEFLSWFRDHSKQVYYKGYQNISMIYKIGKNAIPVDFEQKIGKKKTKYSRKGNYKKGTHIEQRIRFAKKKKNDIILQMLKRIEQRKFKYTYILWDSWYNSSKTIKFLFENLIPKGKILISMIKRDKRKYKYKNRFYDLKGLYKKAGKWILDDNTKILYKEIIVDFLDTSSSKNIKERDSIGEIKICFYKYPNIKRWKALLSTDLIKSELEILEIYLQRWTIETFFKEMKQYFGYDQNKCSNYAAMVADLTIRYVFYIIFSYQKNLEEREKKEEVSTEQILFNFCQNLFELCLRDFVEYIIYKTFPKIVEFARMEGIKSLEELKNKSDDILKNFFNKINIFEKISDKVSSDFLKKA